MSVFIIQSCLLIAIAYILGCMFGALFHRWFGAQETQNVTVSAVDPASLAAIEPAPTPASSPVKKAKPESIKKVEEPSPTRSDQVSGPKDDLKRIKGIGPALEVKLNAAGIVSYQQISKWTETEINQINEMLSFPGRIERENWVVQAQALAKGEETDFAKRVDKGSVY